MDFDGLIRVMLDFAVTAVFDISRLLELEHCWPSQQFEL